MPENNQETPIPFDKWLLNWREMKTAKFISIGSIIISFSSFAFARFDFTLKKSFDEQFMTYLLLFLNIFILLFTVFTSVNYVTDSGKYRIKNTRNQANFYRSLKGFWITTLILYFILAFKYEEENRYLTKGPYIETSCTNIANDIIQFKKQQKIYMDKSTSDYFPKVEYYTVNLYNQVLTDSVFDFVRMDKYNYSYLERIESCSDSLTAIAKSITNEEIESNENLKSYVLNLYNFATQLKYEKKDLEGKFRPTLIKTLQFTEILASDIASFFLFFSFLILYHPEKNVRLLWIKGQWWVYFVVIGTSLVHGILMTFLNSEEAYKIIKLFSGIFTALAMSLLVARFESTKMQSPLGLLIILYLYAIIQSVFGLFGVTIATFHYFTDDFTYAIALIGKTTLYLFILWIYSSRRVYLYFAEKLDAFYNSEKKADVEGYDMD